VDARDRAYLADQLVEDIAPMREHIEDQPAALGLLVVPARTLRGMHVAVEYPPAEIELHGEDAAEIAAVPQLGELLQAGQEQLVLNHAVLQPRRHRGARDRQRFVE